METARCEKPAELDIDRHSESAAKLWKHWLRNFENYIKELHECSPRPADSSVPPPQNKLLILISYVSADVY